MDPVQAISALSGRTIVRELGASDTQVLPLDERIRDAFATVSTDVQSEYAYLMANVQDVNFVASPDQLIDLQARLGDYRNKVETISALTRKGVSAVETLLRS
ncbi:type III secretion system inner rod subunit SctI [Burkholderia semiarida]|uniref:Type III secretion system inner rod subunit SctI n=1 Tax=Burkholderia semiarida TaxID=2843303 RepID=A0ABW7LE59_9BURK